MSMNRQSHEHFDEKKKKKKRRGEEEEEEEKETNSGDYNWINLC